MAVPQHVKGIQSIEIGARLLAALAAARKPLSLTELAAAASMSPSNARRYLISFLRTGFVEQDEASSLYDLSSFAVHLGVSALERRDLLRTSKRHLRSISQELQVPTALVIWTEIGPRVLHFEETDMGVMRLVAPLGGNLSLIKTAAGRIFAAWLPSEVTKPVIEREKDAAPPDYQTILAEIRQRGLSRVVDYPDQGVCILSAPVFDYDHRLAGAIVALGNKKKLNPAWNGLAARELKRASHQISAAMGHRNDPDAPPEKTKRRGASTGGRSADSEY